MQVRTGRRHSLSVHLCGEGSVHIAGSSLAPSPSQGWDSVPDATGHQATNDLWGSHGPWRKGGTEGGGGDPRTWIAPPCAEFIGSRGREGRPLLDQASSKGRPTQTEGGSRARPAEVRAFPDFTCGSNVPDRAGPRPDGGQPPDTIGSRARHSRAPAPLGIKASPGGQPQTVSELAVAPCTSR